MLVRLQVQDNGSSVYMALQAWEYQATKGLVQNNTQGSVKSEIRGQALNYQYIKFKRWCICGRSHKEKDIMCTHKKDVGHFQYCCALFADTILIYHISVPLVKCFWCENECAIAPFKFMSRAHCKIWSSQQEVKQYHNPFTFVSAISFIIRNHLHV